MEPPRSDPDFQAMQQQAIRRVKEMQKKAAPQADDAPSPEPPPAPGKEQQRPPGRLASLFHLDSDVSMILPLLLLLSREGADDALLLALLYIMA